MRLSLFIFALLSINSLADTDLTGNPVEWRGQITQQYREGDNTCFELTRNTPPRNFTTCVYGYYDATQYGAGKWLNVAGLLAANSTRISAAQITLTDAPLPAYRKPMGYGYPRYYQYDPFYRYY
jgi:hypothetical protein